MIKLFRTAGKQVQLSYCFSKREARIEKKLQQEKLLTGASSLDSVVEQFDLSKIGVEQMVEQRKFIMRNVKELTELMHIIQQLSMVSVYPRGALFASFTSIAPLVLLSAGSLVAVNYYPLYAPHIYMAAIKYAGINLCFQVENFEIFVKSGVHWGVAMSLHEQQLDPLGSSNEAKLHFLLATLPILLSILMIQYTCYEIVFENERTWTGLLGLGVGNLCKKNNENVLVFLKVVLGMDIMMIRKGQIPRWLLKLKIPYSIIYGTSLLMLGLAVDGRSIERLEGVYRVEVKAKEELLENN